MRTVVSETNILIKIDVTVGLITLNWLTSTFILKVYQRCAEGSLKACLIVTLDNHLLKI